MYIHILIKICLDIIQIKFYLTVLTMSFFFSISHYQETGCHWVCFITSLTVPRRVEYSVPLHNCHFLLLCTSDLHIPPTPSSVPLVCLPWAFTVGSTDMVSHVTDAQNSRHTPPDSRRNTIGVLLSLPRPFPARPFCLPIAWSFAFSC